LQAMLTAQSGGAVIAVERPHLRNTGLGARLSYKPLSRTSASQRERSLGLCRVISASN